MQDAIMRGRIARGTKMGRSSLTDTDIPIIRASKESCKALGQKYGIGDSAISAIKRKLTWRHVL